MEKLEVVGPWFGTEGGSVDPKRKMGHEEKEKPKEVAMEMDDDVLQEERVDIQSPQKKRKTMCVRLGQSARKEQRRWASCQAPS